MQENFILNPKWPNISHSVTFLNMWIMDWILFWVRVEIPVPNLMLICLINVEIFQSKLQIASVAFMPAHLVNVIHWKRETFFPLGGTHSASEVLAAVHISHEPITAIITVTYYVNDNCPNISLPHLFLLIIFPRLLSSLVLQLFRATGSVVKRWRGECRPGGVGGEKCH